MTISTSDGIAAAALCAWLLALALSGQVRAAPAAVPLPRPPEGPGRSVFETCPPDPGAIMLKGPEFPVHGDGRGDDAPALQAAIDRAYRTPQGAEGPGLVFLPEGTYRLGDTVRMWRGVRVVGFGRKRPTLLLGPATPGFQGPEPRYLIHFCNAPGKTGQPPQDASNITFFSGLVNVDIEIGPGNAGAAAVRMRVAQHSHLRHVDFRLGPALAGIHQAGNEIENCRFFGGRYAILTAGTSASWQFLVLDCEFDGQAVAAIESEMVGLTAIRCRARGSPVGFRVPPERGTERCYLKDCRFEDISKAAIVTAEKDDPVNQLNVENAVCSRVPTFLEYRGGGSLAGPSQAYLVEDLSVGLHVEDAFGPGEKRAVKTESRIRPLDSLPPPEPRDYPDLPPVSQWVSVRDLGAAGDGTADDTHALRRAVAAHRVIYFPTGRYRLSDTLALGPETVLVGLHPQRTRFRLEVGAAGFGDLAQPRPLLETAKGGRTFMTGIGVTIRANPGAVAMKWTAGEQSCLDDVWIDSVRGGRAEESHSLWVTDGGGGTFKSIWSAAPASATGLYVSDTATPGRVYMMSVEHHRAVEVLVERVQNWSFYALQTEENLNSPRAMAMDIRDSRRLRFLNYFAYRVIAHKEAYPFAVRLEGARDIVFRGIRNYSWGPNPFANSVFDVGTARYIEPREIARLAIGPCR
jgi:hypothetical protein